MVSPETTMTVKTHSIATAIRWFLAVMFVMTGVMKLAIPTLGDAFSGQLIAANIPFFTLSRWGVHLVEIALGMALALNVFTRVASSAVIGVMIVATYVHVVVEDPALFPLQPSQPVIPVAVILMSLYLILEIFRSKKS
jgi:uncharacterized membrane protein YphA (DoxX/SURF4 family)